MASPGMYAFERIDDALPFMPLAARRVLDVLGRKLSLEGWLSLSLEDRRRVVRAGAGEHVDASAAAIVDLATPAPSGSPPQREPDASAPPPDLVAALGVGRPIDPARWRTMRPLDRYALVKIAMKPEKLALAYDQVVGVHLTHLTAAGEARMVDVGDKSETHRRAVATACVRTTRAAVEAIQTGASAKGDVLAAARIAGILAAKRTPELVPLCHPVRTTRAAIDFEPDADRGQVRVRATIEAVDRTGVEMEAMVAASVASLTVYDMIKSADRWATIDAVRLDSKSGGKSGDLHRPAEVDEVVSGGFVDLHAAPLSVDDALARVRHPGAGAVCAFLGTVRDLNEGRAVLELEYEAYAPMAIAEMKRIAAEIASEVPGVRLAVAHRTGTLRVGEIAIVCAASAPHRQEAYGACRALIDRVKARVPIWKREHGPDGACWVGWEDARCEGHPF